MKTIIALLLNDLRRDWKHPWSILLFAALPLLMTGLMATIFGGKSGAESLPAIKVAVLDQDDDLISGILRTLPTQGEAAQRLQLRFVKKREEGLRLLEKRAVSAFVVFPTNMTDRLLEGQTNTIELYENPAEQIMPKVVRQGVSLLAAGLSGAADILNEPLRAVRTLIRTNDFPSELAVLGIASQSMQKLKNVRTYLFPPLIQFQTVASADYPLSSTNTISLTQTP